VRYHIPISVKKLPAASQRTMVQHIFETSNCTVAMVTVKTKFLVIPEPVSR